MTLYYFSIHDVLSQDREESHPIYNPHFAVLKIAVEFKLYRIIYTIGPLAGNPIHKKTKMFSITFICFQDQSLQCGEIAKSQRGPRQPHYRARS